MDACLSSCPEAKASCSNIYPNSIVLPWNFPKLGREQRPLQKLMEVGLVPPAEKYPGCLWTVAHPFLAAQAWAQQVCLEKYIPSFTLYMFPSSITGSIFFSI